MPERPSTTPAVQALRSLRDDTALARILPVLPPDALVRLFEAVGPSDAGSLMAQTPPELLAQALAEAAWQEDGAATRFDADVFVDWLAVWLDQGEACAAERLLALDEDLLTLGFDKLVDVHDADALGFRHDPETGIDPEAVPPGARLVVDRFVISPRDEDVWDAARDGTLALWGEAPDRLLALLERLSLARGGLLEQDAAAARDSGREQAGFVPLAAARGFLSLAAALTPTELLELSTYDPESARQLNRLWGAELAERATGQPEPGQAAPARADLDVLLAAAGIVDGPGPAAGAAGLLTGRRARSPLPLELTLARQAREQPDRFARSSAELAYLANVLASARPMVGPARRRQAAARDLALATANLGVELLEARGAALTPGREPGLIKAFLLGWRTLIELPRRVPNAFEQAWTAATAAARARRPWLQADLEASLEALHRAVRDGDFETARDAVTLLSLAFEVEACRASVHLLGDIAAFPLLLEGGEPQASRPVASRADLGRLAGLLDGLALRP